MPSEREYSELPPRVDPATTVQEVTPYEAVQEIHGVRRVSPYSPIAEIDEARVYAAIATSPTTPWRSRWSRRVVLMLLASYAFALPFWLLSGRGGIR